MSGCVVPQTPTYLDPLPEERNRAPRIIEELVSPQDRLQTVESCDVTLQYRAVVEDLDVDDTLTVRWFVNYQETPTGVVLGGVKDEFIPPSSTNRKYIRDRSPTLEIKPSQFPATPTRTREHVVELVVSDGPLEGRRPPAGSDGGVTTYTDSYAWFVIRECVP